VRVGSCCQPTMPRGRESGLILEEAPKITCPYAIDSDFFQERSDGDDDVNPDWSSSTKCWTSLPLGIKTDSMRIWDRGQVPDAEDRPGGDSFTR